jgi:hypothetical protein
MKIVPYLCQIVFLAVIRGYFLFKESGLTQCKRLQVKGEFRTFFPYSIVIGRDRDYLSSQ